MKKQYIKPQIEESEFQLDCMLIVKSLDNDDSVKWVDDGIPEDDDDV